MSFDLIRVGLFGRTEPRWLDQIRLRATGAAEADAFAISAFATDADLSAILANLQPQVIVSLGTPDSYPNLLAAALEIRRRWINIDDPSTDPADIADRIMATFLVNAIESRFPDEPLVSVFTPTYLTGDKIERPWQSLQAQTYRNWEWILYDDSPDTGRTFARLSEFARHDPRVSIFRADRPSGNIGDVKRRACGLARGAMLVELDHDDALTPDALRWVVNARNAFPDAGFFYTDCAEVFDDGRNAVYGDDFAFGFGSYRQEPLGDRDYAVTNYPDVNAKTIRHIVSVPNHLRAWTRDAYWACGGHNPEVHVCDDYELLIRTFLTTRMVHIERFGYIQYHNIASSGNTQRTRNKEIQRLVRYFRDAYHERIHRRFLELGVDDFIWRPDGSLNWDAPNPEPTPIANDRFDGDQPMLAPSHQRTSWSAAPPSMAPSAWRFRAEPASDTCDLAAKHVVETGQSRARLLAERIIRPGMNVIDVGAGSGDFTFCASDLVGPTGRVLAIEADLAMFRLLQANVAARAGANIELLNVAAAAASGVAGQTQETTALDSPDDDADSPSAGATMVVAQTALDDVLDPQIPVSCIKLAIGGREHETLGGLRRTIQRWRPIVVAAWNVRAIRAHGDDPLEALQSYAWNGWRISALLPDADFAALRLHGSLSDILPDGMVLPENMRRLVVLMDLAGCERIDLVLAPEEHSAFD